MVSSFNDMKLGQAISVGSFGVVYRASQNGREVALKFIHQSTTVGVDLSAVIESERLALRFEDFHVVKTLQVLHKNARHCAVIMELPGVRNLHDVLNSKEDFTLRRRLKFAMHISSGLSYIHGLNVIHLELIPSSIFITSNDVCKIGEFGRCQLKDSPQVYQFPFDGNQYSRAPELFRGHFPTLKADVFSFGALIEKMIALELRLDQSRTYKEAPDYSMYCACCQLEHFKRPSAHALAVFYLNLQYGHFGPVK